MGDTVHNRRSNGPSDWWQSVAEAIKPHRLFRGRKSGVLLHISSLPEGNLGPWAYKFIDWLAKSGQTYWQMLPVGPVGNGNSPYSALSSFAGEPSMVSNKIKINLDSFEGWQEQNTWWLDAWCGRSKQKAIVQFRFAKQWSLLREYATSKGVRLIGDVPIFVGANSKDVQANPELFRLNRNGNPTIVTGVPPDCFTANGQRWGHPHYNWTEHKKNKFKWWRDRVRIHLERFDLLRIDHFIGLHHAFELQARAKTARNGVWKRTPGRALLQAMSKEFGALPLIAEDLGHLTKPVESLRDSFALPGVRITQQAIWGEDSRDVPRNHPKLSIAYSGTHDTDTIVGWWNDLGEHDKQRATKLFGSATIHEAVIKATMKSPACIAIIPMQDILSLGSEARMNIPGKALGNWKWKLLPTQLTSKKAIWLKNLTKQAKRCT